MKVRAVNAVDLPSDIDWVRMVKPGSQGECTVEKTPKGPQLRPLVFVSGPYSASSVDEVERNIQNAIDVGRVLFEKGYHPIIPHLLVREYYTPEDRNGLFGYESLMAYTLSIVERCDILLSIGRSPGADREMLFAERLGIPIYVGSNHLPDL